MKKPSLRLLVPAMMAALAAAAYFSPAARSQVMASPSYQAIGVASAGNTSMVWLHEPSSGRVVACQSAPTPGNGPTNIQCAVAKLPYPGSK